MADPAEMAAKQLANIQESTGRTVAEFAAEVKAAGLEKHGAIVSFFKTDHGLTHGNANALAHAVRQQLAGGAASDDELLDAQYDGNKAALRPIMQALVEHARELGTDVTVVVQKTGVSLRRAKQFALVQAPSSKRIQLGLNLDSTPAGDRVVATSGMCNHKANLTSLDEVDDEVSGWLAAAYDMAG